MFKLKKRIASLQNSTANLYIGGNSEIERNTRQFLFEDSILAVRSAIEYGYVIGGNLIIPRILDTHTDEIVEKIITNKAFNHLYSDEELREPFKEEIESFIYTISKCFKNSFERVLFNANFPRERINEIVSICISKDQIYNLKTRHYEKDKETKIINSAQTDIEIMKACFSIIGLLGTSNQFLMTNAISLKQ